jgi:flagellar basal-body rod protein FlgB
MGIGELPVFAALKQKMNWHQTRQGLLAENVANAETPGYRGRDLKAFDFADHVNQFSTAQISTVSTNSKHVSIGMSNTNGFSPNSMNNFEITPEGNGVTLEDEMMKVASNQMDYQAATTLYTRSMRLIKTAIGR